MEDKKVLHEKELEKVNGGGISDELFNSPKAPTVPDSGIGGAKETESGITVNSGTVTANGGEMTEVSSRVKEIGGFAFS